MPALLDDRGRPEGCLGSAAEPCPELARRLVEDMVRGAIDTFLLLGRCEAGLLQQRYGFSSAQVLEHAPAAIREARRKLAWHPGWLAVVRSRAG